MTSNQESAHRRAYLSALCRATPYHVVSRILADPRESSLGEQEFTGSVLYLDLVGFTPLCERLALSGAQGLSKLSVFMDGFFETLEVDAIFPYEGYLFQFAGDAIGVFFRGDDHARRCLACALTIRQILLTNSGQSFHCDTQDELLVRMGLSMGTIRTVVLGDISRRIALATGATIHRAIALQQQASPGEILADLSLLTDAQDDVMIRAQTDAFFIPADLLNWPRRSPIHSLTADIQTEVEDKISFLEPFVPYPLAQRMQTAPKGWRLKGEIRRATIVFADLKGFDESPRNLTKAQDISRSLMRAFRKYDGVLLNSSATSAGHRVLFVFGLLNPSENDSERAILASLEAVGRTTAFLSGLDMPLSIKVGVHTGDLYLGSVGSHRKHDLTVIGDAVNVAARVTSSAEDFQVLATADALDSVRNEFFVSALKPVRVKGKNQALQVHVVHGTSDGRSHYMQQRSERRELTGREAEIEQLNQIVDRALNGQASLIGITGPPGSGKSALLSRVVNRWIAGGGIGVIGNCRYVTMASPLAPVVEMFSTFLGITQADTEGRKADSIRRMLSHYKIKKGVQELLAILQPIHRPDGLVEALVDLADRHKQERVLDAISLFVDQRVQEAKMLYVIEDLHLADSLTLQLINRLTSLPRNRSFLLLGTYRPDDAIRDTRRNMDIEIRLDNLNLRQTARLACHELGAIAIAPDLAEFLWRRTMGNPEFLVQIVRFLSDRLLINVQTGTAYASEPGITLLEDVVPSSWAHVVLARLEGLGEVERHLLRTASVIGHRFVVDMLRHAADICLENDLLDLAMVNLQTHEVITPEAPRQQARFRFRDDVTRAIAYSMIPDTERRQLHKRIADALETQEGTDSQAMAAALAHHRDRAGQWSDAAHWYEKVACMSAMANLNREARYFAERWEIAVSKLLPAERPGSSNTARVGMARLRAVARLGQPRQAVSLARTLLQHHKEDLDCDALEQVDVLLADAQAALGHSEEASKRLLSLFDRSASSKAVRFDAAELLCRLASERHDFGQSTLWLKTARELCDRDPIRSSRCDLLQASDLIEQGQLEPAREHLAGLVSWAEQENRAAIRGAGLSELGKLHLYARETDQASEALGSALELQRRLGNQRAVAANLVLIGQNLMVTRQTRKALDHLEEALQIANLIGDRRAQARAEVHLGAAIATDHDPEEGLALVLSGQAVSGRVGLKLLAIEAEIYLLNLSGLSADPRQPFISPHDRFTSALGDWLPHPLHRHLIEQALEKHPSGGNA